MRHLKVVTVAALIIVEAALAATPLVHTYVRDRYYVIYDLNLHDNSSTYSTSETQARASHGAGYLT